MDEQETEIKNIIGKSFVEFFGDESNHPDSIKAFSSYLYSELWEYFKDPD